MGTTDEPDNSDAQLVAGTTLGDGRFRLLIEYGGPQHLQFWQAIDTALGRQVALTVIDPDGALPAKDLDDIVWLTARLRGIDMPGVAPVLSAMRTSRGGLVVSPWIRGATLAEVAKTAPAPIPVAGAMLALTEAADAAHRAGMALSIDHPGRLRVSTRGDVVLAFPATMPDATPLTDLRGIGGAFYALLVNRWPSPHDEPPGGWKPAEVDTDGRPREPAAINPEIPFLVSAAAAGLIRDGGLRSADTVLSLLRQAIDDEQNVQSNPPRAEPPPLPAPGGYAGFRDFGPTEQTAASRRQTVRFGVGAAAVVVVVILVMLAWTLNRIIGGGDAATALNADKLGLQTSPPAATPGPTTSPSTPQAALGNQVKPLRATVFSPGGKADSPESARLAIDGDPATAWSTDTYYDPVPFPTFKEGVGLLLQLPQPTVARSVTVDLSSSGTVVQIRSSPNTTPAELADTVELTPQTPLHPGHNSISVNSPAPVSNLLVWISTLGTTGGDSHSDISEITVQAASPRE